MAASPDVGLVVVASGGWTLNYAGLMRVDVKDNRVDVKGKHVDVKGLLSPAARPAHPRCPPASPPRAPP
eukprot:6020823-Pyramimonas_sp.AAC.1